MAQPFHEVAPIFVIKENGLAINTTIVDMVVVARPKLYFSHLFFSQKPSFEKKRGFGGLVI